MGRSISNSAGLVIRPAQADDYGAWLALWRGYCAALDGAVPDAVTEGVWRRILTSDEPVGCLLACRPEGEPVGLANYVLHPNTWSLQTICYLEDLFVTAEARGSGAGRALIDSLVALGKERGWRRVYWHTREKNYRARTLYDRVVARTDYIRYDIDLRLLGATARGEQYRAGNSLEQLGGADALAAGKFTLK